MMVLQDFLSSLAEVVLWNKRLRLAFLEAEGLYAALCKECSFYSGVVKESMVLVRKD